MTWFFFFVSFSFKDPFTGTARARISCGEHVKRLDFCFMFGVERDLWNDVKRNGLPRDFAPPKHSVRKADWCDGLSLLSHL